MTGPSFTFRLERVRALRERAEDHAKEELATCLAVRLRGEGMLRAATAELEAARAHRRGSAAAGAASGDELVASQAYLEKTALRREAAALDLDRREAEVDARRSALEHAARERQVLEKLKERRRSEHAAHVARLEGAAFDELSIGMHRQRVSW